MNANANGAKTIKDDEPTDADRAEVQEMKGTAEKATELSEEVTAGEVDDLPDEFCKDDVYNC